MLENRGHLPVAPAEPVWRQPGTAALAGQIGAVRDLAVRAENSSVLRDQAIFADRAVGAGLSSDAVPVKKSQACW